MFTIVVKGSILIHCLLSVNCQKWEKSTLEHGPVETLPTVGDHTLRQLLLPLTPSKNVEGPTVHQS